MEIVKKQEQQGLQEVSNSLPSSERGKRLLSKHSVRYSTNGSVIRLSREEAGQQCAAMYSLTPTTITTLSKPDSIDGIIQTGYNIEKRESQGKDPLPTIAVLADAFGDDMVISWMFHNIEMFIELLGVNKTNVSEVQKQFIAQMLIDKFSQGQDRLNTSEILLFFYKAAKGDCGKFFGSVDTQTVGEMAEKFLNWRDEKQNQLIKLQEEEERKRKHNEMMQCPPPTKEQLEELHRVQAMFSKPNKVNRDEKGNAILSKETEAEKKLRDDHNYEFAMKFLTPEQRKQLGYDF